jgi:hypothetical protein
MMPETHREYERQAARRADNMIAAALAGDTVRLAKERDALAEVRKKQAALNATT